MGRRRRSRRGWDMGRVRRMRGGGIGVGIGSGMVKGRRKDGGGHGRGRAIMTESVDTGTDIVRDRGTGSTIGVASDGKMTDTDGDETTTSALEAVRDTADAIGADRGLHMRTDAAAETTAE